MKHTEEEIVEFWRGKVIYSEESPSGIVWKKNGKLAGYLNPNGYWYVGSYLSGHKVSTLVHRIVMFLHVPWQEGDIDHINGHPEDNRIENLRIVSTQINCRNTRKRSDNSTGYTGVSFEKPEGRLGRYRAHWIDENGKPRSKSFAISRCGEGALQLAVQEREAQLRRLKYLGEGYTERHGL